MNYHFQLFRLRNSVRHAEQIVTASERPTFLRNVLADSEFPEAGPRPRFLSVFSSPDAGRSPDTGRFCLPLLAKEVFDRRGRVPTVRSLSSRLDS